MLYDHFFCIWNDEAKRIWQNSFSPTNKYSRIYGYWFHNELWTSDKEQTFRIFILLLTGGRQFYRVLDFSHETLRFINTNIYGVL